MYTSRNNTRKLFFSRYKCNICEQPAKKFRTYSNSKRTFMLCDSKRCSLKANIFVNFIPKIKK